MKLLRNTVFSLLACGAFANPAINQLLGSERRSLENTAEQISEKPEANTFSLRNVETSAVDGRVSAVNHTLRGILRRIKIKCGHFGEARNFHALDVGIQNIDGRGAQLCGVGRGGFASCTTLQCSYNSAIVFCHDVGNSSCLPGSNTVPQNPGEFGVPCFEVAEAARRVKNECQYVYTGGPGGREDPRVSGQFISNTDNWNVIIESKKC
jgi:hypothetical protein